ncbi:hypothetical protein SBV1_2040014 [Verrucomicrobia bacterium]|nr:hypothetical protein SBV1_2040014 [Verrucomicrobiota bacterium]
MEIGGKIQEHHDKPEILLEKTNQLTVVGDRAGVHGRKE